MKDLKERMGEKLGDTAANSPGTEVAVPSLRKQIEAMLPQFEMAMPRGFEAQQLIRDAFTLMRVNPRLAECSAESVLGGLMTFAQLGLRPGVMGQGWLLPFKKNVPIKDSSGNVLRWVEEYHAQIVIGYQGYVELVHRSGAARKVVGRSVHENDFFEIEYGLQDKLTHRPPARGGARGAAIGYYAIIFFADADPLFWFMTREEAVEWRNKFAMGARRDKKKRLILNASGEVQGDGPWFDMDNGPDGASGFDQQAIKTCFLRAKRWAPKSTDRLLTAASQVDGAVRLTYRPDGPDDLDDLLNAEPEVPAAVVVDADPDPGEQADGPDLDAPDQPATQDRHRKYMSMLGPNLVKGPGADAHRHAVLTTITGLEITTASDPRFTNAMADKVFDTLRDWGRAGSLAADIAALAPTEHDTDQPAAADGHGGANAEEGQ